jgi:hypothetical protein
VNQPPLGPPAGRPPQTKRQILGARIAGVLGLLLILLPSAILAIAPGALGWAPESGSPYVWSSGSRLFLDNLADLRETNCTLTGPTETRQVTVDERARSIFVNFETNGVYVHRWEPGAIDVICDNGAGATTGPILWFFPLGATPWPFVIGLVLVSYWYMQRGGRRTRYFFGPRSRR